MNQVHLFISGTVQGVGFRQFVKYHARKRQLTGWVRNLVDGRVEAVIHGEKSLIEDVIRQIHKGPMLSQVTEVSVVWEEVTERFSVFETRETAAI